MSEKLYFAYGSNMNLDQMNRNITENGDCQFSFIKERVALELARKVLIDGKTDPK